MVGQTSIFFNMPYLTSIFHNPCLTCIFEFIHQRNEISKKILTVYQESIKRHQTEHIAIKEDGKETNTKQDRVGKQ